MIEFITDQNEKKDISTEILQGLPEWFGIPESMEEYILDSMKLPFWAAYTDAEMEKEKEKETSLKPAGFLAMKKTGPTAAEIYVMAVGKKYQRSGFGRALWLECMKYAQAQGFEYMQVKTVKRGCCEAYNRTNDFYQAMGFRELECFPELWDSWNPCQQYIQYIGKR